MPTVLVTGSSGFVGSCARTAFASAGWHSIGIGRRPTSQDDYLRCDLSKPFSGNLVSAIERSDVVIHAAARSSPWGTKRQFRQANVVATEKIVEACQAAGQPKLIFLSSSSIFYRPEDQIGIDESTVPAEPAVNHYAATKQIAETIVRRYEGRWTILRPRAVYGKGDTVLFPRILAAAQAGRLPLLTRPGDPVVGDLISIDHLTDCLVKAAQDDTIEGEFNLTDNAPQEIVSFLLGVFERLEIPRPKREIPVSTAFRFAHVLELIYGGLMPWREPPITRFGVHVFAYSKVFKVDKMLRAFGQPKLSTEQSVERFVEWVQHDNPYGLK
ncbi:NAD-dependent epimerase/dehydratase family protein [Roseiconus lacunae]|uniref:NAD-dependent epimerase/dehydratase family protein n=1 Tax=Roseiconus lacunae TaxID=2605694 RepID=UPI001E53C3D3|nr:NAD(P)-dependent oxidoreductase [Roseiconus lacunae]MCD0461927.1 NAD(P)-dependent oxidoreductase [Roseiconus lacunae]